MSSGPAEEHVGALDARIPEETKEGTETNTIAHDSDEQAIRISPILRGWRMYTVQIGYISVMRCRLTVLSDGHTWQPLIWSLLGRN